MSTALSRLPSIRSHRRLTKEQKQMQVLRAINNYNNAVMRHQESYEHAFNNPTNKVFEEQFKRLNAATKARQRKARVMKQKLQKEIKQISQLLTKTTSRSEYNMYRANLNRMKKQLKIEKAFLHN